MIKRLFLVSVALTLAVFGLLAKPKYIFFFIGDGMGMGHIMAAKNYLRANPAVDDSLLMLTFPTVGIVTTYSASSPVTDSAAAGTALACGKKTNNRTIGVTPDGKSVESMASFLHREGYGVGLITTVAPDDATPAAFYAHVKSRSMFDDIAMDAIRSDYEFIGGANLRGDKSLYGKFKSAGVFVARGAEECLKADTRRVLLLNTDTVIPNDLGYVLDRTPGVLDLPQMTHLCLNHLKKYTPDRFFMMVEGGSIDHAAHANDGASVIKELLSFDESLAVAYDFYLKHPEETLIIVTADHDTGGMATVGGKGSLANVDCQKISKDRLNDMLKKCVKDGQVPSWEQFRKRMTDDFSFGNGLAVTAKEEEALRSAYMELCDVNKGDTHASTYASYSEFIDRLYRLVNSKMSIRWITNEHTANPVAVFAIGKGTEELGRMIDNTQIYDFVMRQVNE